MQLNAGESNILYLVMVTGAFSVGKIGDAEIFRITQTQFVPLQFQQPNEEKISEVLFCCAPFSFFRQMINKTN